MTTDTHEPMRHLLAAALLPDTSTLAREKVVRGFWSACHLGGAKNGTTIDLAARREAARLASADVPSVHFLSEE